jgi:hypothetical protein
MKNVSRDGNVGTTGEMRNTYEVRARISESNTQLGRCRCRTKGNIKMGVKKLR